MPEIHPIFVFEVAQAIDLDDTERMLAGAERPAFRHRGRATSLLHYRPAPLRVAQEGTRLAVGAWRTDPTVDLVLYDFGAASVAYHLQVDGGLDALREASASLQRNEQLREDARTRVEALLRSASSAVVKPRVARRTDGMPASAKRASAKGSRGTLRIGPST